MLLPANFPCPGHMQSLVSLVLLGCAAFRLSLVSPYYWKIALHWFLPWWLWVKSGLLCFNKYSWGIFLNIMSTVFIAQDGGGYKRKDTNSDICCCWAVYSQSLCKFYYSPITHCQRMGHYAILSQLQQVRWTKRRKTPTNAYYHKRAEIQYLILSFDQEGFMGKMVDKNFIPEDPMSCLLPFVNIAHTWYSDIHALHAGKTFMHVKINKFIF